VTYPPGPVTIDLAHGVGPARLDIAYERLGDPRDPVVLLIMGLGAQLLGWPDGLCDLLVERELQVIRFDNRDVGQSTHMTGTPDFMAAMRGDFASAAYTLSDMAADAAGLLDALGIDSAHVVGASLGGFVAQMLAIEHRPRVRSLTSIMSTTGDPRVGQPHPEALALFAGGAPSTRDEAVARAVHAYRVLGSPGFPLDVEAVAERTRRSYDRAYNPGAILRQATASLASGDRTQRLRALDVPTLVIHGDRDRMCDPSGGRATAAAIPDAELVIIEGMGHDLARPLWPELATRIHALVERVESRR